MNLYIPVLLVVIAVVLWWWAGRERRASGVSSGRVIYSDTYEWRKVEKPLFDPDTGVIGRPDYLVHQRKIVIPVEVKSGTAPAKPYDSHIFQLAAYCLLVEKKFGKRPPYGLLHYDDNNVKVEYTKNLEEELRNLIDKIRRLESASTINRSHNSVNRCRGCGFAKQCEQRL